MKPGQDLYLDWYPLYKEIKLFILPQETNFIHTTNSKRNPRTLTKMCTFCQLYTDPSEIPRMLEEFLPYVRDLYNTISLVLLINRNYSVAHLTQKVHSLWSAC